LSTLRIRLMRGLEQTTCQKLTNQNPPRSTPVGSRSFTGVGRREAVVEPTGMYLRRPVNDWLPAGGRGLEERTRREGYPGQSNVFWWMALHLSTLRIRLMRGLEQTTCQKLTNQNPPSEHTGGQSVVHGRRPQGSGRRAYRDVFTAIRERPAACRWAGVGRTDDVRGLSGSNQTFFGGWRCACPPYGYG